MERKRYTDLKNWKKSKHRKPLLLMGARQVGKTYLLRMFGEKEFKHVVYLNFDAEKERYAKIFESSIKPIDIIQKLELVLGLKIDPKNTLLIFDEVQELPRALTSLKYFCEDAPEYFVAASGSLLGVALSSGTSFPVGKVDFLELCPMDFEEFLSATGNRHLLKLIGDNENWEIWKDTFELLFRQYLIVGGMPEAVATWVKTSDFTQIDKVQNAILLAYLNDISKHANKSTAIRIHQVWQSLPAQFAKRNEKFMFGVIKEGARAREYELAIQWLVDCRIVRKVTQVKTGNKLPLKSYANPNAFKLYFLDIGLFRHLAGADTEAITNNDKLFQEFGGFFAEQFVLEQLAQDYEFYYWTSDASAEVDFITTINNKIIPIEVKSGTNVKAKSLRIFRDSYNPEICIRFSFRGPTHDGSILNIPIYWASSLKNALSVSIQQKSLNNTL